MEATVLGCGIAGSWLAHELANRGYDYFILFDGASDDASLRQLGPIDPALPIQQTKAQALAEHIKSINPKAQVEINGFFDLDRDQNKVRGLVLGGMSSFEKCAGTAKVLIDQGHAWLTLALPSQSGGNIVFGTDPSILNEQHFGGTIVATREEINRSAAQAIDSIKSSSY